MDESHRVAQAERQAKGQAKEGRDGKEALSLSLARSTSDEDRTTLDWSSSSSRFSPSSARQKPYLRLRERSAQASEGRRSGDGAQGARQGAPAGRHWKEIFFFPLLISHQEGARKKRRRVALSLAFRPSARLLTEARDCARERARRGVAWDEGEEACGARALVFF